MPVDVLGPEIESTVGILEDFAFERFRQATSETCAGHFRNAVQCPLSAFAVGVIDAAKGNLRVRLSCDRRMIQGYWPINRWRAGRESSR